MAVNLLEKYGIKEVADVTLYEVDPTKPDGLGKPVLYLDTLKISTLEQTADQAEARGGKGNSPLIIWDYGKEITVTLQDALFSAASLAVMFAGGATVNTSLTTVPKFGRFLIPENITEIPTGTNYYSMDDMSEITATSLLTAGKAVYERKMETVQDGKEIVISAENFPGTYALVGDTYARNKNTGKDEYFQFVIPQAKMGAENTITLEAEGDPSVFDMTMRVLRPEDGQMMKLRQYNIGA